MDGQVGVAAAVDEAEAIVLGHLVHEADATRAQDATLVIEDDTLADVDMLGLLDLVILEAGISLAVLDGELLEAALARLVANGAVEGVVDEKELKDALAAFLDERGVRADAESLGDLDGAGDGGTRAPSNDRAAILAQLGLAVRAHLGSAHLDQAHAAVARGAERRMVTVMGDVAASLHAGLDQAGSLGELLPLAVDLDIHHWNGRSSVLGLGFGGGGGGAHRGVGKEWRKRRPLSPLGGVGARKKG